MALRFPLFGVEVEGAGAFGLSFFEEVEVEVDAFPFPFVAAAFGIFFGRERSDTPSMSERFVGGAGFLYFEDDDEAVLLFEVEAVLDVAGLVEGAVAFLGLVFSRA